MSRTRGSNFTISDIRIADFRFSLKKILSAFPPIGLRGSYDFEKKFKDLNTSEYFCFKYALIDYILHEEKVGPALQKAFRNDADILFADLARTDRSFKKNEKNERLNYYTDNLSRVFGKNRFNESSELEMDLYRYVFQNLFKTKYISRSVDEWQRWFLTLENELEIIPQFIIWYHEAVLTVLTLYDESLWTEN